MVLRTHQLVVFICAAGLAWAFSACSLGTSGDVRVLYVAPEVAECVGVDVQSCLLVREDPSAEWQLFYDTIQGFDYELGTEYVLEVEVETVPSPLADASSLRYRLVRILQSRAVGVD